MAFIAAVYGRAPFLGVPRHFKTCDLHAVTNSTLRTSDQKCSVGGVVRLTKEWLHGLARRWKLGGVWWRGWHKSRCKRCKEYGCWCELQLGGSTCGWLDAYGICGHSDLAYLRLLIRPGVEDT